MRALLMVAVVSALVTGGARADAGPPPADHALGAVVTRGSAQGPLAAMLRTAAGQGLAASGAALVATDTVATILGAVPDLATCDRKECLVRFASATGASRVVAVTVDGKGQVFRIGVVIADDQGRPLRRRDDECAPCDSTELQEHVSSAVRDAAGAGQDDEVEVDVASTPPGARLVIDGAEVGATPWHGKVAAGRHRLEAIGDGRAVEDVFVEAGGTGRWSLTLTAGGGGHRRWGKLAWISGGAGAGLLIGGVVLVALDGKGTCGTDTCPEVYQTGLVGWTGVTLGVVGLAAGGYMMWSDRRHHRRRPVVTVVPTGSGWAATLTGRF